MVHLYLLGIFKVRLLVVMKKKKDAWGLVWLLFKANSKKVKNRLILYLEIIRIFHKGDLEK